MGEPVVEYKNGTAKINPSFNDEVIVDEVDNDAVQQDVKKNGTVSKQIDTSSNKEGKKSKGVGVFLKNVKADILNKDLLPLKILFFFKYATLFVLYPFLTLQLKSLGLDEAEAGVINALIPIVSILGPPLAGVVADKIGNFKILLSIITLLNAPLALFLLLVPTARENVLLPQIMMFSLSCASNTNNNALNFSSSNFNSSNHMIYNNSSFILASIDSSICTITPNSEQWNHQSNIILQCGHVCSSNNNNNHNLGATSSIKKIPIIPSGGGTSSFNKIYQLPNEMSIFVPLYYTNNNNLNHNLDYINNQQVLNNNCINNNNSNQFQENNNNCTNSLSSPFDKLSSSDKKRLGLFNMEYSKLKFIGDDDNNNNNDISSDSSSLKQLNVSHPKFIFQGHFKLDGTEFGNVDESGSRDCLGKLLEKSNEDSNMELSKFSNCQATCLMEMNRTLFCSNTHEFKANDVLFSFIFYTIVRVLLGVVSATGFVMFEGAVLIILKEFGGDYGLQRVSATLAAIVAAPLAGIMIEVFDDFRPAFYLYGILQIISTILTIKIHLEFRKPGDQVFSHLKEVLSQMEVLIFFIAMLLSGTAWGYLESFLFWFLESLGAGKFLMGLTISVGGLAGIPLLILSRPIIKKFGHVNVLAFGLLCFFFRLVGYSYIENPWTCLIFEAMEAFTASLAITGAATYSANLSTSQTIATVQGIWGSLYFGIGRGIGSFFGGFFQKWYGARQTFRIFALMSLVGAILYFLINQLYIKKITNNRKLQGVNFGNIKGDRKQREENEIGKMNNEINKTPTNTNVVEDGKFDGGYMGVCDVNKFTDVPLDEETTITSNSPINKKADSNNNGKGLKNRIFGKKTSSSSSVPV